MEQPSTLQAKAARRAMDQEAWRKYQAEGQSAFAGLYEAFFDRLFVYGCTIVSDETFVKDAIQEVFLKLPERDRRTIEVQNISSYLFVALRNYLRKASYSAANKLRHQEIYLGRKDLVEMPKEQIGPDPNSIEILKKKISQLPERQREILFLRFFEGLDYKEISQLMSINHQVVRNYAYRGMQRLRKNMEGVYPLLQSWVTILLILSSGIS